MPSFGGVIHRHSRLRIAYFSQHHVDALSISGTDLRWCSPVEILSRQYPGSNEDVYRGVLGKFGITGTTALQPLVTLSGGQKSRVVFAMMRWVVVVQGSILRLNL